MYKNGLPRVGCISKTCRHIKDTSNHFETNASAEELGKVIVVWTQRNAF